MQITQSDSDVACWCGRCTLLHHCLCQPRVGKPNYTPDLYPRPTLQDAVSSGGPLLAILAFCILPLVWSVPEALITAELATAFPENSGYVAWVTAAFGPFWGFQVRRKGLGASPHPPEQHGACCTSLGAGSRPQTLPSTSGQGTVCKHGWAEAVVCRHSLVLVVQGAVEVQGSKAAACLHAMRLLQPPCM